MREQSAGHSTALRSAASSSCISQLTATDIPSVPPATDKMLCNDSLPALLNNNRFALPYVMGQGTEPL